MKILAIESSCDETAAAVVEDGRKVLSSVVFSQIDIHKEYGGVVPEIASRYHIEKISQVVQKAMDDADVTAKQLDAVAVTAAPGLIGALLVGVNYAKGFCFTHQLPLIPVHHLRGHIAANYLAHSDLQPPFLALVVSGGHSHIIEVRSFTDYQVIGHTRDDAAGEAFDKGARTLGLPYPGGVHLDRLAKEGDASIYSFPRVSFEDAPYDFSFSGVKTALVKLVNQKKMKGEPFDAADIAAGYQYAITTVLTEKFLSAAQALQIDTLVVAGGVSANSFLRFSLQEGAEKLGKKLYMPPLSLCGDNAAMIGAQAYFEAMEGHFADTLLNAYPTWPIQENIM